MGSRLEAGAPRRRVDVKGVVGFQTQIIEPLWNIEHIPEAQAE